LFVLPLLLDVKDELITGLDSGDGVLVPFSNAPDVLFFYNFPIIPIGYAEPVNRFPSPM